MPNIPVTLAVKNLLDADNNTQFATALGALGAPVETGASIATKLAGETLVIDGFTVTNFSGLVIPNNTYGQKDGVPHFGNVPLGDAFESQFLILGTSVISNPGLLSLHVGSIPLTAANATDGKIITLDVSLRFDCDLLSPIHTAPHKLYLMARFGLGTPVFTSGAWIETTPKRNYDTLKFRLLIYIQGQAASPFRLTPIFNTGSSIERYSANNRTDNSIVNTAEEMTLNNAYNYNAESGQATSIELYLASISSGEGLSATIIDGSIKVIHGNPFTGYLL